MVTRTIGAIGLVLGITAAQNITDPVSLARDPEIKTALEEVRAGHEAVTADQIRLCEIPAPPFGESRRAAAVKQAFEQIGLTNVRVDNAGNVMGEVPGQSPRPHVAVAAHLDTVFPEGTNVRVRRTGSVLTGPGIGDNCRGLATLLAVARVLKRVVGKTPGSLTFVADAGEEGLGNLRGIRAFLDANAAGQRTPLDRFVSIDGTGLFVANAEVGSRRYRVTFSGPGGHSYVRFGTPNPIQAMGRAIARISQLSVPSQPKTTFSVGRVGGGTSVNAIPAESWMEVDLRSVSADALRSLEGAFKKAVDEAVREEDDRWGGAKVIKAKMELVGERPAGRTPDDAPIVRTALAAANALGLTMPLVESSTDASLPLSRGIPAITIGTGGKGSGQHTSSETFDTAEAWRGVQFAVLLVFALAR